MARPQQPDLDRSGALGPVPEANLPGHHPPVDQDKPTGPPPVPDSAAPGAPAGDPGPPRRYAFQVDPWMAPLSLPFGVVPRTAWVEVGGGAFAVRFGPWRLSTPLDNVAGAEITGPYQWFKVAGPPRLSLKDRGVTLATSRGPGVCVRFAEPVGGVVPGLRHPAVTVTVAEPHALLEALTGR